MINTSSFFVITIATAVNFLLAKNVKIANPPTVIDAPIIAIVTKGLPEKLKKIPNIIPPGQDTVKAIKQAQSDITTAQSDA